jgi:integrase
MGMIYKRGMVYWIKYYRSGKPYRESTRSKKTADAKRLLKKREGKISEGKLPGIYFDRVRFDELAEDLLTDYRINQKKTLVRAARSVEHLRVPYIPMLNENNTRKGFFEHGDFIALRDSLPDYLKDFVTFGYKVGWRVSEIGNLTWKHVDLEHGIVRLEPGETKNDEGRTVYLDEEVKGVFAHQWEVRKKSKTLLPYIFLNKDGADKIKRFDKAWKTACQKVGVGVKIFHDLRRTAVRNMVRSGIPERVAMMISGHKTRSVFDRHNIVNDTDLRLAGQKQETYLQAQMGTNSGTIHNIGAKREMSNSA